MPPKSGLPTCTPSRSARRPPSSSSQSPNPNASRRAWGLHRCRQDCRPHRRIKIMKAVVVTRSGGPEVLEVRDMPDPQPKAGRGDRARGSRGRQFCRHPFDPRHLQRHAASAVYFRARVRRSRRSHRRSRDGLHPIWRGRREDRHEAQAALAAAQGLEFGAVGGLPGELPDRLSGLLEGRTHPRRLRADSVATISSGVAC